MDSVKLIIYDDKHLLWSFLPVGNCLRSVRCLNHKVVQRVIVAHIVMGSRGVRNAVRLKLNPINFFLKIHAVIIVRYYTRVILCLHNTSFSEQNAHFYAKY